MRASDQYAHTAISTQQKGKLVVMLYDGAVKFLKIAKDKLREGDFASKGIYIGKAQDIVAELSNSLNVEAGPQIANDLRALYDFVYRHLNAANIERDPDKIDDCIKILDELRTAWEQVASAGVGAADGEAPLSASA